jgi:hypothetical protein
VAGVAAGKTKRPKQLCHLTTPVFFRGTGKTYTAFQIIWRLWKAGAAARLWHWAKGGVDRPSACRSEELCAVR